MSSMQLALGVAQPPGAADLQQVSFNFQPWTAPQFEHPVYNYQSNLATGSHRSMLGNLRIIAGMLTDAVLDEWNFPWHQLRYQHTTAVRAALVTRYAPAKAKQGISHLKGVLRECWRLKLMETDDYMRAVDIARVKGKSTPPGRHVDGSEIRTLFEFCWQDKSAFGARDAAILAALFGAGLRRGEVANLNLKDFNEKDGTLRVRLGKGKKDRTTVLARGGVEVIDSWLEHRGRWPGALICPLRQLATDESEVPEVKIYRRHVDPQTIYDILQRRADAAGVQDLTVHDARRTWIGDLFESGANAVQIQSMAGHSSLETTGNYNRLKDKAMIKAGRMISLPVAPGPEELTLFGE